jgi:protein SCO1/2
MRQFKARLVLLIVVLLVVLGSGFAQALGQSTQVKHFKLAGTVKSVDAKDHKLVVDHKEIPGFMAAMTMPYSVRKEEDLTNISPGDQIAADVVVTDKETHLESVKVTSHAKAKQ